MKMENRDYPCLGMVPQLSGYLDDALSDDERHQVQIHLGQCESCRLFLEDIGVVQEQLRRETGSLFAPENLEAVVWGQIGGLRSLEQKSRLLWIGLLASGALALIVVAGAVSPLGGVVMSVVRLMAQLSGYGWTLLSHLLQMQSTVIAWVVAVGGLLAISSAGALRWLSRQPSLGGP